MLKDIGQHKFVALIGLMLLAAAAFVSIMAVTLRKLYERVGGIQYLASEIALYSVYVFIVVVPVWMILTIKAENDNSIKRIYISYATGISIFLFMILYSLLLVVLTFMPFNHSLQGSGK